MMTILEDTVAAYAVQTAAIFKLWENQKQSKPILKYVDSNQDGGGVGNSAPNVEIDNLYQSF